MDKPLDGGSEIFDRIHDLSPLIQIFAVHRQKTRYYEDTPFFARDMHANRAHFPRILLLFNAKPFAILHPFAILRVKTKKDFEIRGEL